MRACCILVAFFMLSLSCGAMKAIGKFNNVAYQLRSAVNNARGVVDELVDTRPTKFKKKNKNQRNTYNKRKKASGYSNAQDEIDEYDEDDEENIITSDVEANNFYPSQGITNVAVNEKGNLIAIFRRDGTVEIQERNNRKKKHASVIQSSNFGGIKSLRFAGDNHILYTYSDKQKNRHLMLYKRDGDQSFVEITPVQNSRHIRLFGREDFIIVISQTAKRTFIHKLDVNEFDDDISKESLKKALKQIVTSEYPVTDVVVNSNNDTFTYVTGDEEEKSLTLYDNGNIRILGPSGEKDYYIALDNRDIAYKLSNGKIWTVMKSGASVNMGEVGIDENCKIHTDANGVPCFVTWCDVLFQHVALQRLTSIGRKKYDTASIIKKIDKRFQDKNWLKIDNTKDNRHWLIKVTHATQPTEYYMADILNMSFELIAKDKYPIVHSVREISIPTSNGKKKNKRKISGICVFPTKYTRESPTAILLRRSNRKYFSWEYNPQAQFLADAGFFVICLNQDCDDDDNRKGRSKVIDDIYHILNWGEKRHDFADGPKKARTIFPISCDKTVIISNCRNAEPMLNYFSKHTIEDRDENQLGGLCLIDPIADDMLENFKSPISTLILFSVKPSDRISGKNVSAVVIPASKDALRTQFLTEACLYYLSTNKNNKNLFDGKTRKSIDILVDQTKLFSKKK